jgi:hypothetical protein
MIDTLKVNDLLQILHAAKKIVFDVICNDWLGKRKLYQCCEAQDYSSELFVVFWSFNIFLILKIKNSSD